jgi:hypothetical protein
VGASRSFNFDGASGSYVGTAASGLVITVVSLGLAAPIAIERRERWRAQHTTINGHRLVFTGKGSSLYPEWLKWWLLTVVTLGIYSFWVVPRLQRWVVENTDFDPAAAPQPSHYIGGTVFAPVTESVSEPTVSVAPVVDAAAEADVASVRSGHLPWWDAMPDTSSEAADAPEPVAFIPTEAPAAVVVEDDDDDSGHQPLFGEVTDFDLAPAETPEAVPDDDPAPVGSEAVVEQHVVTQPDGPDAADTRPADAPLPVKAARATKKAAGPRAKANGTAKKAPAKPRATAANAAGGAKKTTPAKRTTKKASPAEPAPSQGSDPEGPPDPTDGVPPTVGATDEPGPQEPVPAV